MEMINKFMSLLLVFTLTCNTVVFAGDDEDFPDDYNPYTQSSGPALNPDGTPAPLCIQMGESLAENTICCDGLVKNPNTNRCDEPVHVDPSLVSCSSHSICSGGTACLPLKAKHLFSNVSPSPASEEVRAESLSAVEMQISDIENFVPVGGECTHARECSSYSCLNRTCVEQKVCRYVDRGEVASGGQCGRGLVLASNGTCELSATAQHDGAIPIPDIAITTTAQCTFDIDPADLAQSNKSMRSIRAMEWLLASNTIAHADDCFGIIPVLKDEIGTKFLNKRKVILKEFSIGLNAIENDFKLLKTAKDLPADQVVTIHGDEQIKAADLATRQTSGYDSLVMMKRRNLLFQKLEAAMLENVNDAITKVSGLSAGMSGWKDGDSSWNNGIRTVNKFNCNAKYKKFKPFKWKTYHYGDTSNRWANRYKVTGTGQQNMSMIKKPSIAGYLAQIGGISEEAAIREFTKSDYYLYDPLMQSGLSFTSFGQSVSTSSSSSFNILAPSLSSVFSRGRKDLRKTRTLKGDGAGSYNKIYEALRPKLKAFYTSLKTDPQQLGFVYEPELGGSANAQLPEAKAPSTAAKDCLDPAKLESSTLTEEEKATRKAECTKLDTFLSDVLDEGFAQWLAYSVSQKSNYAGYFENASTWRRKLLKKYSTDMTFMSKYYEKMIAHRNDQNECIVKVIAGLRETGILNPGKGGLVEGGDFDPNRPDLTPGNYYDSNLDGANVIGGKPGSGAMSDYELSKLQKSNFNLKNNPLNKTAPFSMKDNYTVTDSNLGDRANVTNNAAAILAARKDALLKKGKDPSSSGLNGSDKTKAAKDLSASLSKNRNGSGNASGSGSRFMGGMGTSSNPASTNDSNAGSASLGRGSFGGGAELGASDTKEEKMGTDTNAWGAGLNNGIGFGSGMFMEGPNGAGGGGGANGEGEGAMGAEGDYSGLSDSDKDRMLSDYEQNKDAYEGHEDDGIFSKVSKAYVRNLDKVLVKKKTID